MSGKGSNTMSWPINKKYSPSGPRPPLSHTDNQLTAGVHQSGINASLGASVPQTRGVSKLDANMLQSLGGWGPQ